MKKPFPLVASVLLAACLAACGNDEAGAEAAVEAGEQAIRSVAGEASRYVPGKLSEVRADLAAARRALSQGRWAEARAAGTALTRRADDLAAATARRKGELARGWTALTASLPRTMAALRARLEELDGAERLPGVLDAERLGAARKSLDGMALAWEEATAAFEAGDLPAAVARASDLALKGDELTALLGVSSPAPDAGPRSEVPAR